MARPKAVTSLLVAVVTLQLFPTTYASSNTEIPDETWGYVEVRRGAFMFWWLYGADAVQREDKPLVMWLQGGPGSSSTGYGNFEEIGPFDVHLEVRNTTWIKEANVLFVDNPVGCGYSYVLDEKDLTANISDITLDLMVFFQSFLEKLPIFKTIPFHIAGESYGGKMAAAFGAALHEAILEEKIQCKFAGVALGDSLISFPDIVTSYGPYLYSLSLLDEKDLYDILQLSTETAEAAEEGNYSKAMHLSDQGNILIAKVTDNVDVYDILQHNYAPDSFNIPALYKNASRLSHHHLFTHYITKTHSNTLVDLMNGPIRKKLGIIPDNVTWGGQSGLVEKSQYDDIPSSVLPDVGKLIRDGMKVVVYEGQLDMICGVPGAESWINKLDWDYLPQFLNSSRKPLYVPSKQAGKETAAFLKAFRNVELYYILNAGHMVPIDAPEMALEMLRNILKQT